MGSLMSLGARAMTASYAVLQTTGHNIANASTAGYSRQQIGLQPSAAQSTGSGWFGQGVDVKTVTRANDRFLTREAATTQSLAAADATRLDRLQQLEKVFPTGEEGLGHAADQLMNAFVDVASRPQDTASRQVVLARAEDAAARFRDAGERIDGLQTDVTQALRVAVGQLGALAQGVAHANAQIVAARGAGQPPNDLLDERDRLVGEIGKLVQVSSVAADDG